MAKQNTTRGHAFELTAKGKKELAGRGGQAGLLFGALKSRPSTTADLVSKLVRRFESKEIAKLNISWYMSKWKSDGFVKFASKKIASRKTRKSTPSNVTAISSAA